MLGFTTNQLAVLFLALLLGWLLGLISRSGGRKWRRAYEAEVAAREDDRRTHLAEMQERDERIRALETRPAPAVAAPVTTAATAAPLVTPSNLDLRNETNRRDDLSLIRGVGRNGQDHLNDAAIYSFRQVRTLTDEEAAALESRLGAPAGTIARDRWREQAALLEDGKVEEHRRLFA